MLYIEVVGLDPSAIGTSSMLKLKALTGYKWTVKTCTHYMVSELDSVGMLTDLLPEAGFLAVSSAESMSSVNCEATLGARMFNNGHTRECFSASKRSRRFSKSSLRPRTVGKKFYAMEMDQSIPHGELLVF